MTDIDPADLTEALMDASRSLVAVAARSLAQLPPEVTIPQFRLLVLLSTKGPHRVTELANELRIAPSSVTRLCDRLVARDYVSRVTPPANRREVEVGLSPAGEELVQLVTRFRRLELQAVVDALPTERRRPMIEALTELSAAMAGSDSDALGFGWTS